MTAGQGRLQASGQRGQETGDTTVGSNRKNLLLKTTAILHQHKQQLHRLHPNDRGTCIISAPVYVAETLGSTSDERL